jgi:ubiquinone/menaquinone biosynthesis C-methylase UbiE
MMSRAVQSELLEQRITENVAAQQIDLATWIFERAHVRPGENVLELCCGTGGQTLTLLDGVGETGSVVALDISQTALETLRSKAGPETSKRLICLESRLEDFPSSLVRIEVRHFDLIFCAYGLYYSSDSSRTLQQAKVHLKSGGRIVVVGPFGPNNNQLFDLVRASGVELSPAVVDSSEKFMLQTVLPWGARNFESLSVHTMVNPVRWTTPERVLNYWKNTTFYDASKQANFEKLLNLHFERHAEFINEKWVMLVEMRRARS